MQVRTHHFDGEPAPELVCNIHESTSNEDMDDWSPIVEMSEDFEWLGPLYAAPVAAALVDLTNWASHYSINPAAVEALQSMLASTPAAPGIDLEQLIEVRNRLHVMSCRVGEEWEAEASELQNDVQKIIDRLQGYPCGRRDIRALFEEWAWPRSYSVVRYGEQYVESVTKKLWSAWQAAMQARNDA